MRTEINYTQKKSIDDAGSIRFQTSTPLLPQDTRDYLTSFLEHAAVTYFASPPSYQATNPVKSMSAEHAPRNILQWEWRMAKDTVATLKLLWNERKKESAYVYSIEFYMEGEGVTDDVRDYLSDRIRRFDQELARISGRRGKASSNVLPAERASVSLDVLVEGEAAIEADGEAGDNEDS